MNTLVIKSTLAAAALAVSLGTITAAKAGQVDETFVQGAAASTQTVSFSRAELATEDGRTAVERRIHNAAEDVCGPLSYRDAGSLQLKMQRKACYKQAVAQAMSQIDADQIASTAR